MLGFSYGAKAECDLAKLRILGLMIKRKNLFTCVKMQINANNVCLCALFIRVPYCLEEKSKKCI